MWDMWLWEVKHADKRTGLCLDIHVPPAVHVKIKDNENLCVRWYSTPWHLASSLITPSTPSHSPPFPSPLEGLPVVRQNKGVGEF